MVENDEKIELSEKEIQHLIDNYNQNNGEHIVRFMITLIYNYNKGLLGFAIKSIWRQFYEHKKYDYLQLLGPLLLGSPDMVEWFGEQKLDFVLKKLIKKIQNYSPKKHKKLNNLLYLVSNIVSCQNEKTNRFLIQYHLEIYSSLKTEQKNDLKNIEIVNYELIFKILKDLIMNNPLLQENFIQILIDDLSTLSSKKIVIFAEQFLVPFLNACAEIPVCLHPYYYKSKKYPFNLDWPMRGFPTRSSPTRTGS